MPPVKSIKVPKELADIDRKYIESLQRKFKATKLLNEIQPDAAGEIHVLSIGCGYAEELIPLLLETNKKFKINYVGIDCNEKGIKHNTQERFARLIELNDSDCSVRFICADAAKYEELEKNYLAKRKFDLVFLRHPEFTSGDNFDIFSTIIGKTIPHFINEKQGRVFVSFHFLHELICFAGIVRARPLTSGWTWPLRVIDMDDKSKIDAVEKAHQLTANGQDLSLQEIKQEDENNPGFADGICMVAYPEWRKKQYTSIETLCFQPESALKENPQLAKTIIYLERNASATHKFRYVSKNDITKTEAPAPQQQPKIAQQNQTSQSNRCAFFSKAAIAVTTVTAITIGILYRNGIK